MAQETLGDGQGVDVSGGGRKRNDRSNMNDKKILGAHYEVGRVAMLLDMSPRYVKDRIKAGDLEGYRLGNRIVVSANSLQAFLDNRKMAHANH
jgi:hypothetical protein